MNREELKRIDEIGHAFGTLEDCSDYEIDVKSHDIGWWQCYVSIREALSLIPRKRAGNAASTRSVALSPLDRSNLGSDSPTAPDSPRFPCDRCECADICDGPCPEYEEWEEWLVCGARKAVKGKREQHSVGGKRSDARVSSPQKTHPALDSQWDCQWLREECKNCYYYHNPVYSKKMPDCPLGLHPKWREIY